MNTESEVEMETEMNGEEDPRNDSLTNRLVLGLAAHPLSSCNPPPPELPDLLDSLIASEERLTYQLILIQKVGSGFVRRIRDLKNRVQRVRAAKADLERGGQTPDANVASKLSKDRRILEAQELVLQKMCLQIAFILETFTVKIRQMTNSTIKAHRDIFDEFLGQRHSHPGIQVADSTKLLCTPDCEWYQKHGPYEWSKKPYTNLWWEEMNNTDWDWLRIKEHIAAAVTAGGGQIIAMFEQLQANSQKFVPSWFWNEDFETWTMHADMESVKNTEGHLEDKVVVKVRFNKSVAMIQQETVNKLKEMEKAQNKQENAAAKSSVPSLAGTTVEIDKIGETVIDQDLVFDAWSPSLAGLERGGPPKVRWLVWWGFERWHSEALQKRFGPAVNAQNRVGGVQTTATRS